MKSGGHAELRRTAEEAERRGDLDRAVGYWRSIVSNDAADGDAWIHLAALLTRRGAFAEAESIYRRLLSAFPGHPVLLNNLGLLLRSAGRADEAIVSWNEAARADPRFAEPLINAGILPRTRGNSSGAIEYFERAIACAPTNPEAHFQLGHTLQTVKQFEPAIKYLRHAVKLDPRHDRARFRLCQCYLDTADFMGFAGIRPFVDEQVEKARRGMAGVITPWFVLPIRMSAEDRRAVASVFAAKLIRETASLRRKFTDPREPRERLHIGYISADFRNHAIMHLANGMIRRHDRSEFRVTAYAIYPPDDSGYAARLRSDVDAFHDISTCSIEQAVRTIREQKVDILIDLSGFTAHARPNVLAARPAPVQISWLGFPGTMSGEIYDYLIADQTVVPTDCVGQYDEKIVWMPYSYQINDNGQPIAEGTPSRGAQGLPDGAFVFTCFCQPGRVEQDQFALWMNILGRIDRSVLWLFSEDDLTIRNLRHATRTYGIDPARLVFAKRLSKPEHLARLRLADLALDTGTYGAHTTASDALWAGVPFLTVPGDSFAGRVGSSLLGAIGLPELIAGSAAEYVELAVALANDPDRLGALRRKLAENRLTMPLFDTAGFVRALERAYKAVWSRFEANLAPESITIPAEAR